MIEYCKPVFLYHNKSVLLAQHVKYASINKAMLRVARLAADKAGAMQVMLIDGNLTMEEMMKLTQDEE